MTDRDPGTDDETLRRLFDLSEPAEGAPGGAGFGLSITRRLAELMGDGANATLQPGRGCAFGIFLQATHASSQLDAGNGALSNANAIREGMKQSSLRIPVIKDQTKIH